MKNALTVLWLLLSAIVGPVFGSETLPKDFVDAGAALPGLVVELRYAGSRNLLGRPVDGYEVNRCLLTRAAVEALAGVQAALRPYGLGLKVYDCYRPERAVRDFSRWAQEKEGARLNPEYHPTVPREELFRQGYFAHRSAHSRGSTVDLTLVPLPPGPTQAGSAGGDCTAPPSGRAADGSLDLGTGYDCLHPAATTESCLVGPNQRALRLLLLTLMEQHGFENYKKEWWHYSLKREPYPDKGFDVPVR
ncbi:MAG: hypothetical protein A2284_00335 [Deltaproteobacteria bacterium RIFOXYA12_FULL_61_11]|nr:MAG: hypothetical protein A2284_00335 [Deltaproteobacteria bacterium RIFOXYA12_FULL_61_11]